MGKKWDWHPYLGPSEICSISQNDLKLKSGYQNFRSIEGWSLVLSWYSQGTFWTAPCVPLYCCGSGCSASSLPCELLVSRVALRPAGLQERSSVSGWSLQRLLAVFDWLLGAQISLLVCGTGSWRRWFLECWAGAVCSGPGSAPQLSFLSPRWWWGEKRMTRSCLSFGATFRRVSTCDIEPASSVISEQDIHIYEVYRPGVFNLIVVIKNNSINQQNAMLYLYKLFFLFSREFEDPNKASFSPHQISLW